jgi:hypothetical protein
MLETNILAYFAAVTVMKKKKFIALKPGGYPSPQVSQPARSSSPRSTGRHGCPSSLTGTQVQGTIRGSLNWVWKGI